MTIDNASPEATSGRPSDGADPQQETVRTADGVEFLHAGSGNTLGDGRTAGGASNAAARDALPDANDAGEDGDGGSATA